MDEIVITSTNGQLTTSSLGIAEKFGKQHKHVIDAIEELKKGVAEISADPMFIESTYQHPQNKQWYKCYELTRDGFSLLVMGFTGKKALGWKLKYIEAFNLMEQKIRNGGVVNIEELITKAVTSAVAETIKVMIPLIERNTPKPDYSEYEEPRHRGGDACGIIGKLEPVLRNEVADMIISNRYSYEEIKRFLAEQGISVSVSSIQRYKKRLYRK